MWHPDKISINLTDYKIKYPDSVLSYDFVDSDGNLIPDRIRFISKGELRIHNTLIIK